MKNYGVKLLRLPTGYWNWVDLGDNTPDAPPYVASRFKNLQSVKPHQYEPFIDKIFQFAQKYEIKVFPEMHGAPGSQNGEIHRQEPSFFCFWITPPIPQHAFLVRVK